MGNRQTNQTFCNFPVLTDLNSRYRKQLLSNIKENKQFSSELKKIIKKMAYLNFKWVEELSIYLVQNSQDIYKTYVKLYKKQIIKQSKCQFFYLPYFNKLFFPQFQQKLIQSSNITPQNYMKLFEEANTYLMITQWIHSLMISDDMFLLQSPNDQQQKLYRLMRPLVSLSKQITYECQFIKNYFDKYCGKSDEISTDLKIMLSKFNKNNSLKEILIGINLINEECKKNEQKKIIGTILAIIGENQAYITIKTLNQLGVDIGYVGNVLKDILATLKSQKNYTNYLQKV